MLFSIRPENGVIYIFPTVHPGTGATSKVLHDNSQPLISNLIRAGSLDIWQKSVGVASPLPIVSVRVTEL